MIFFALAFVLGAFCLQQTSVLPSLYWALLLIPLVAGVCFQLHKPSHLSPRHLPRVSITLCGFLLGFFWAATFATARLHHALPHEWETKPVELVGVVASLSQLTERGERFHFDVEQVLTENAVVPQHISLSFYPPNRWGEVVTSMQSAKFKAGERWQLTVRLKRPHSTQNPHGFDFESWALAENIRAVGSVKAKANNKKLQNFVFSPKYIVEHVRELIKQRIERVLSNNPYRGVIQALVMGDDSQIALNDWQVFLRTGTSHLMSISGLHITMLSGLAFGLMSFIWRRIPKLAMYLPTRKAATLAGVLAALIYALIAGFSVPTQRTLYMLMVFALALWSGRQLVISQVLALALFVVVVIDPWAVISAGFWLSFGAVAMLSFALGGRIGQVHWLKVAVHTQWAVTIGMVPLLLIMFHQASIVSPIANAFAIPLISFVVTPLALLGSLLPIDAPLNLSYQALNICMAVLKWLNQLPNAVWQQHAPATWTLFSALLGVAWMLLPRGMPMRWLGVVGILPMLIIVPERPAAGNMKVTVLDVGQGLGVVVQTASHTLLYDAGSKYNEESDAGSRIVVPFLQGEGVDKLDGFVVSHNDVDHSGGMPSVLALMPLDWLVSSLPDDLALDTAAKRMKCYAGQHWVWDGVSFDVLHPMLESYADTALKDNNRSCVVKITSASGSVLLAGDIEKDIESALVAQDDGLLNSDVLVAPHHGSKTSSTAAFIDAVSPSVVVFTSGYLNRFKHPVASVMERYQAIGSAMFRSDYHGALTLSFKSSPTDEGKIQAVSWRAQYKRYWHDVFER